MLSHYDVEFDFPKSTMAFWSTNGCRNLMVPWHSPIVAFRVNRSRHDAFAIPVALNGHVVRALLDTGSDASVVKREAALAAGVTPAALDADKAGARYGLSGKATNSHLHHFETVRIGPEIFHDTGVIVADDMTSPDVDMLLGADFMRRRRIWVSYSTDQVFIQAPVPAALPGNVAVPEATPYIASLAVVPIAPGADVAATAPARPNQPAMPVSNPAGWVRPEDYPSISVRRGEQGKPTVGITPARSVGRTASASRLPRLTCRGRHCEAQGGRTPHPSVYYMDTHKRPA